jgi:hypothetical protein
MSGQAPAQTRERDLILVWIDGREASIVRPAVEGSGDEEPTIERMYAAEPPPPHPTGHLRHNPGARHGEEWKSSADRRRDGQLTAFLAAVEERLVADADVLVIGPGPVHERLARQVQANDRHHRHDRSVTAEASVRLTPRQLQARYRAAAS